MASLDEYIFSPQYRSPVELAKGDLSVVLCDEDAATLLLHLNLYRYGQALIPKCGGALTSYSLIRRDGHQPVRTMFSAPLHKNRAHRLVSIRSDAVLYYLFSM